jgi:hypothetical protein
VDVNRVTGGGTVIVNAVFKMCAARALLPTGLKCSLGKNYTFLIALESSAVVAIIFILCATNTCAGRSIAQHVATKVFDRVAVEPFRNGHVCNIVTSVTFGVDLVIFLAANP